MAEKIINKDTEKIRREKLEQIKKLGINPYPKYHCDSKQLRGKRNDG